MATASLPYISIEEYLHSDYQPDMDYVDGHLEERNLGEFDHGDLQLEIGTRLRNDSVTWGIRVVTEARVQVSPTRFRVPDICVLPLSWKREPIIRQAPLLCLEVLSPEDRVARVRQRGEDFLRMGVPEIWIFDPAARTCQVLSSDGLREVSGNRLQLAGTAVMLDLPSLFAVLDR